MPVHTYDVAGSPIRVDSFDESIFGELDRILPRSRADDTDWRVTVCSHDGSEGRVAVVPSLGHQDLFAGLDNDEFPFEAVPDSRSGLALAFRGETDAVFWTRGDEIGFRLDPRWQTYVSLLIYHKAIRLQEHLIFFHASTVSIENRGCMFVGPKGAGKSTVALALATRGHQLFGDETAAWHPATNTLRSFRRHLGLKPGPRSKLVQRRLDELGRSPEAEGIIRLDVLDLFPASKEPLPTPLKAIFLLRPFSGLPQTLWRAGHSVDLRSLQPISGSIVNAPVALRTFQLSRMLSLSRICELHPGDPDDTAELIEQEVLSLWDSP